MPFPQKLYRVTNSNISNSTVRTFSSFLPLFTHLIARLSHRRRLENIRFRVFFFGDFNVSDLHRAFECEALRFPPQPGIEAAEETIGFRVPQVRCKLRLNYINRGEQNEKTAYSKARLARACKFFIVHGGNAHSSRRVRENGNTRAHGNAAARACSSNRSARDRQAHPRRQATRERPNLKKAFLIATAKGR